MQLHVIAYNSSLLGPPYPGTWEPAIDSVVEITDYAEAPPQIWFWDQAEARAALVRYLDGLVEIAVADGIPREEARGDLRWLWSIVSYDVPEPPELAATKESYERLLDARDAEIRRLASG